MDNTFSYQGLCISSGGYKGIGILGALTVLDINGHLRNVKTYAGCSVGAIITFLMACGWKPMELYRNVINIKLFHGISSLDIKNLNSNYGLTTNDSLRDELESLVLKKRSNLPTMLDLFNEGYYVSFSVCDRRTKSGYKIDYTSHPTLLASEAALMSANIPFMFTPIEFKGMQIVDGALTNPFPLDYIDNKERSVLGIVVYGKTAPDKNLMDYILGTLMIQIEELQRIKTRSASSHVDVLEMSVDDLDLMNPGHGYGTKNKMYFDGIADGKLLSKAIAKKHRKRSKSTTSHSDPAIDMKNTVRTHISYMPEELLIKCLISQPVDILCQSTLTSKSLLQKSLAKISEKKLERLKSLAREILVGEDYFPNTNQDPEYKIDEPVTIKENYSQKLFDNFPPPLQSATVNLMRSLPEEKVTAAVQGLNILFEGLNRLGINIFDGFMLGDGREYRNSESPRRNPQNSQPGRVEIMEDEEGGVRPGSMDDVD